MRIEDLQYQQQAPIAVASSLASAELVAATLRVNGIEASVANYFSVYPSIEWVEGWRVTVAIEREAAARDLLREVAAQRDDLAEVEGEGEPPAL